MFVFLFWRKNSEYSRNSNIGVPNCKKHSENC